MHCSRCGLNCDSCENRDACGCPGCLELEDGNWAGECDIKKCCEEKRLDHCGLCPKFPCDMLRNTSFDEEDGDGGERLVTLKRWAEKKNTPKERSRFCIIAGFSAGVVLGAVFGALSGNFAAVMLASVLVGTAIGVMLDIVNGGK